MNEWTLPLGLFLVLLALVYRELSRPNYERMTPEKIDEYLGLAEFWKPYDPKLSKILGAWPYMNQFDVLRVMWILKATVTTRRLRRWLKSRIPMRRLPPRPLTMAGVGVATSIPVDMTVNELALVP